MMRRTILLVGAVALVLLLLAPSASAIPEPKGCPSDSSMWVEVYHPNEPGVAWASTSFWQWYSVLPGALEVWYEAGYTDEEIYWFFLMNRVDRNEDDVVCAWHAGSIPAFSDDIISIVDNNANAMK